MRWTTKATIATAIAARPPQMIADCQVERQQDRNHGAADVDRQNRSRPIDRDRRKKWDAKDFHHFARNDALFRQTQERQIHIRAEQRAEQHQRHDARIEAERGIGAAQEPDLQQNKEAEQDREEQRREGDAEGKVMHVRQRASASRGWLSDRRAGIAQAPASAAMILSACGFSASAFWNGPPGGRSATPLQRGRR